MAVVVLLLDAAGWPKLNNKASPGKDFPYLNATGAVERGESEDSGPICTGGQTMIVSRDLSKRAEQPLKMLQTRQEKLDSRRSKAAKDNAGPAWFNMPAPERTPELEQDLRLLSMRAALDPKQHYRTGEKVGQGKYLQVGTVVHDATGHYTDRLTRRQRGTSMLDTLMRDTVRQQYLKRKFEHLQEMSVRKGRVPLSKRKPWLAKKEPK